MVGGARKAGASLVNDVSDAARAMLAAGRVVPPAAPLAGLAAVLLDPLEGFLYSPSLVTVASSSTVLPAPDLARNWGRGGGGAKREESGHGERDHRWRQNAGKGDGCAAQASVSALRQCGWTHVVVNQADQDEDHDSQGQPGEHTGVALRSPGWARAKQPHRVGPDLEGLRPLR